MSHHDRVSRPSSWMGRFAIQRSATNSWAQSCLRVLVTLAFALMLTATEARAAQLTQQADLRNSVTRQGFTWTFAGFHRVGKYVNGDWWVKGPVTVVNITPKSKQITDPHMSLPRWVNGSQVNPSPKESVGSGVGGQPIQGFDSGMYRGRAWFPGAYDHSLNVGAQLPLALVAGDSLVSTWTATLPSGNRPQVKRAAVLTVVGNVPPTNSFRPGYTRVKGANYKLSQLDLTKLGSLAPVSEITAYNTVVSWFDGVWLDHIPGFVNREIHPQDWMENYSREHCRQISEGALMLQLDNLTTAQKRKLAIRMVQVGLDFYHVWLDKHPTLYQWAPGDGQGNGRRFPIMMAGHLLGAPELANAPLVGNEMMQTFTVLETEAGVYNYGDGCYGPQPRASLFVAAEGDPEYGSRHWIGEGGSLLPFQTFRDYSLWSENMDPPAGCNPSGTQLGAAQYRRCCTANCWWGEALALMAMGLQPTWNHDVFFQYLDRYRLVQPLVDPGFDLHAGAPWCVAMWDQHRASFDPVVWVP